MKTPLKSNMPQAVEEMLETKNWTGLSLRELAAAGRVVPEAVPDWIQNVRIPQEKPCDGAFYHVLAKHVSKRVRELNES